ncbi:MAG: SpoIIIAH-like family protein [Clostridia bacterium]|nr:SpoIIIAH-like family protein [Clostridia bacterium]
MKKRGAIYSVIALMLCAAVYLNWNYSKNNPEGEGQTVSNDYTSGAGLLEDPLIVSGSETQKNYFAEARLSRQKARDEAVNILNSTIESVGADENDVAAASAEIKVLAENSVIESRIENLIVAKGFKDCVVFVNDSAVNVIIEKDDNGVTDEEVAKIRDIVMDEAKVTADRIKIIESE